MEIYPSFIETGVDTCDKEALVSIIDLLDEGEKREKGEKINQ